MSSLSVVTVLGTRPSGRQNVTFSSQVITPGSLRDRSDRIRTKVRICGPMPIDVGIEDGVCAVDAWEGPR